VVWSGKNLRLESKNREKGTSKYGLRRVIFRGIAPVKRRKDVVGGARKNFFRSEIGFKEITGGEARCGGGFCALSHQEKLKLNPRREGESRAWKNAEGGGCCLPTGEVRTGKKYEKDDTSQKSVARKEPSGSGGGEKKGGAMGLGRGDVGEKEKSCSPGLVRKKKKTLC